MKKTTKTAWIVVSIVVSSLLVLIMGFLSVYFLWPWNKDFFDMAKEEFAIPGLGDNFVPQGLTSVGDTGNFLVSGYMTDKSPSRIYYVDGKANEVIKYVTLKMSDSEADYIGHAGGIAFYGDSVWVSGDGYIHRLLFSDINRADNAEKIYMKAYMKTGNGADFVYAINETLWVGEFYKEKKYETSEEHHLKTTSGETNRAVAYGFVIDEGRNIGLQYKSYDEIAPTRALSLPDLVQGMTFSSDGKILLSTSWSLSDSVLKLYRNVFENDAQGTVKYGYYTIDLWYLDDNSLVSDTRIPSMSEEIVSKNDIVYVLFESGCKKYKLVNRVSLKQAYSFPINSLRNYKNV